MRLTYVRVVYVSELLLQLCNVLMKSHVFTTIICQLDALLHLTQSLLQQLDLLLQPWVKHTDRCKKKLTVKKLQVNKVN